MTVYSLDYPDDPTQTTNSARYQDQSFSQADPKYGVGGSSAAKVPEKIPVLRMEPDAPEQRVLFRLLEPDFPHQVAEVSWKLIHMFGRHLQYSRPPPATSLLPDKYSSNQISYR